MESKELRIGRTYRLSGGGDANVLAIFGRGRNRQVEFRVYGYVVFNKIVPFLDQAMYELPTKAEMKRWRRKRVIPTVIPTAGKPH